VWGTDVTSPVREVSGTVWRRERFISVGRLSTGMEEVLFEHERRQTREETAAMLRDVADRLEAGEPVTLSAGGESMTLEVPANPTFEVKVERETSGAGTTELSVEFELEWKEGESSDGSDEGLSVE